MYLISNSILGYFVTIYPKFFTTVLIKIIDFTHFQPDARYYHGVLPATDRRLVFFNLEIFSFLLKSWFSDPTAKDLHLLDIEISCLGNKREKLQMTASWTFISTACYVKLEFNPYCVAKDKKLLDVRFL